MNPDIEKQILTLSELGYSARAIADAVSRPLHVVRSVITRVGPRGIHKSAPSSSPFDPRTVTASLAPLRRTRLLTIPHVDEPVESSGPVFRYRLPKK